MQNTRLKQKTKKHKITFSLESAGAKQVFVAGDFNNWNTSSHPMKKTENGSWEKSLFLHEGSYEYKFLVDDQWAIDPNNERACENCFGSQNNIVRVVRSGGRDFVPRPRL